MLVTADETFQFAAAVAGVSIGLAAVLMLAILGSFGMWRVFRLAGEAAMASARAAVSVEELARRVSMQSPAAPVADIGLVGDLRRQTETLVEEQRNLQEMAKTLFETAAGQSPALAYDDLASSITRLDATVGQMAASLANLIQLLEQERR
jgi:hypothetical protein